MGQKYKIGDKVKIYSYDELLRKINNGFTIKSDQFKLYNKNNKAIYALFKETYDNISNGAVIKEIYEHSFSFKCENRNRIFFLPYEFIKPSFSLPDELFKF